MWFINMTNIMYPIKFKEDYCSSLITPSHFSNYFHQIEVKTLLFTALEAHRTYKKEKLPKVETHLSPEDAGNRSNFTVNLRREQSKGERDESNRKEKETGER